MSSTEYGLLGIDVVLDEASSILPKDIFETQQELDDFVRSVYEDVGLEVKKGYLKYFPATLHRNTYDSLYYYWAKRKKEVRIKSYDKKGTPPKTWNGKSLSTKQKKQWQYRYMALAKGSEVDFSAFTSMSNKLKGTRKTGVLASQMGMNQKKVDKNAQYSYNTFNNQMTKATYEKYQNYGTFTKWSVEYQTKKGQTKHKTIYVAESLNDKAYGKRAIKLEGIGWRRLDKVELASTPQAQQWRNFLYEDGRRIVEESVTMDAICNFINKRCQKILEEKANK